MKETEQTLLDQIKEEVASRKHGCSYGNVPSSFRILMLDEIAERYATAKAKAEPPTQEQLQKIETEYQNRIMNTLMDKWGLSVQNARDIGRDLFYTYVFPVYELGGQFGFKAGYTRSQVQASCEATLKKASENAKFDHAWWMQTGAHRCNKSSITDPNNITIV